MVTELSWFEQFNWWKKKPFPEVSPLSLSKPYRFE
jgi:hypothetical protein